ncbi:MAG TPA: hypothetical protein VHC19_29575, partial [Pirellulales bacterium]|nr:hypothetical protein [Pirellulales bacterium]
IVSARFRIPIEPLSFVWAAGAVAPLVDRLIIVPWTDWRERRQEAFDDALPLPHPVLQGPHVRAKSPRPTVTPTVGQRPTRPRRG